MAIPFFSDIYKLFHYQSKSGPLEKVTDSEVEGVGITSPDARWDIRNQMQDGSQSPLRIQLGDTYDLIDHSSITSRKARCKEYERLESIPEIHTALNTFADEACLGGNTNIATPFGYFKIKDLAKQKQKDERFLVYCWDFEKDDYTLGWAFNPRLVKNSNTVEVAFDDGKSHFVTEDHRFLTIDNRWVEAIDLKKGDKLKAFYRLPANQNLTKLKYKQFTRIFTYTNSWMSERNFLEEWKTGKVSKKLEKFKAISRNLGHGLKVKHLRKFAADSYIQMDRILTDEGFNYPELKFLNSRHPKERTVIGVFKGKPMDVYDLSVDKHENFATDSTIVHNCQTDESGNVFKVSCKNREVQDEVNFVMHKVLGLDNDCWDLERGTCKFGDQFLELIVHPNNPKAGIVKVNRLPPETMYRIETIKGRLVEFQQSQEGPDFQALAKNGIENQTAAEIAQATALRFHPDQIVHIKIGDARKTFYPYGVSILEAARGPAIQLKMMEDAMLAYRLVRAPERRIFYIDVGTTSGNKAESAVDRLKDQFRKKKVFSARQTGASGASAVEEKWNSMPPEEDFFIPIRPNSQTRIETLPGAQNLNEIDDALYFRQRLFTALQFPKNYLTNEDPQATRLTLSQQDVRFARLIERLQKPVCQGLLEIATRHLNLRGFPQESFADLEIKMTPPSDWRQINRNEVTEVLFNRAAAMKGSQLMSDYDIYVRILGQALGVDEQEAKEMVTRNKAQKYDDMKLALIGQNPDALGLTPMAQSGPQIGTKPDGPNPMLSPDEQGQDDQGGMEQPQQGEQAPEGDEEPQQGDKPQGMNANPLPEPSDEDIQKYNLDISNFSQHMDDEEIDVGEISDGDI